MNGFVPVQAFGHQPLDRPPNRQLVAHRDLVFNHGVHGGMDVLIRKGNAGAPMVVQHLFMAFVLVERQPLRWDPARRPGS